MNESTDDSFGGLRVSTKEAIAKRVAIAARLASIVDDAIAVVKKPTLTTELHLLRRELARSRPLLRELRSERDFLSIIALIEASLENVDSKELTKPELEQIRDSLTIGTAPGLITHSEVTRQARVLRNKGFQTLPVFDFDVNDVEDENETEACEEAESSVLL